MCENYQIPRGTQDVYGGEARKWQALEELFGQFCFLYNYDEIRTPIFEHTNIFKRGNDASDVVNKEMYTFTLKNSTTSLTLRPEMTAGVARSFVENKMYGNVDLPAKFYYAGPQFRHERPQKGRMRIFHQFGIEVIGAKEPILDVEVMLLGYSFVRSLGLKDIKILVNTLGDEASRNAYRDALKEHFKGDIDTMCSDCKRRFNQNPLRILDCKLDANKEVMKSAPKIHAYLNDVSKAYFKQVLQNLDALGIPYELDDRLVRGLDYYCDTVFEVVSTNKQMGAQSTLFAGGRYDGLIQYFGGPQMSGIGWGMGVERLLIACESEAINLGEKEALDVYVMCLSEVAKPLCFSILTTLRSHGYRCDMDYMNRSFKAQFRTVDRKKAKFVILIGNKDIQQNTITVKEIKTQKQVVVHPEEVLDVMDTLYVRDEHEHDCDETCHCKE
ncbi:MAG: histidine--tRNA ligase [Breznakia sp.]